MERRVRTFTDAVWAFYKENGRHRLPWRRTKDPYRILVSEIMLQQTQVDRVIPKYRSFLKRFPTAAALARSPLGEVLREWQGLGYNRRAKLLHEAAKTITKSRNFPKTQEGLLALPGVGAYTASAVMTFAYNEPVAMIETNIRTVFIHHFFRDGAEVLDRELMPLIERTLDRGRPREWYYALMDYGSHLKRTVGNANMRSAHYVRQSAFKGSDREIRGAVVRALSVRAETRKGLHSKLRFDPSRIDAALERLREEGMLIFAERRYQLPS